MKTLVIIPTYNERDNIARLLESILSLKISLDLLVVDDNSPDGTGEVVDELARAHGNVSLLTRTDDRGFGRAYVAGFRYALERGYDLVQCMDADLSHDPRYMPDFHEAIQTSDFVIGSRYINGISVVNWPLRRLAVSTAANLYVRAITGLPATDCTSGFQLIRTDVLKTLDLDKLHSTGYSFLVEIKYRAHRKGFRLKDVPIIFVERREGVSKLSTKVFLEALLMPVKLRMGL